jgi:hypothetical protein
VSTHRCRASRWSTKDGKPLLDKKGEPKTMSATAYLARTKAVQQMVWAPGEPTAIHDRLMRRQGGWFVRKGATTFNLYRAPPEMKGNPKKVKPWLDHIRRIYPDDVDHIIWWCAHRVQRPGEKINHALVLGGAQGIGKDTLLEPVKYAIGHWNFGEVSPKQMSGRFNEFLARVILRVNEARDLGDVSRYAWYEQLKPYTAAPPDVLRVDEKNVREYNIINCVGIIITTNHKCDGIFLPPDDRRHYVAWSERTKDDFTPKYWNEIYHWYQHEGGNQNVTAYLAEVDLSKFDAKAPPPKTEAWWAIVDSNRAPEEAELADVIDTLGNPKAVTIDQVIKAAGGTYNGDRTSLAYWLTERKNRRAIPHRFEQVGYKPVRNEARETGLWVISGKRQVVYARQDIAPREQFKAVTELQRKADEEMAKAAAAAKAAEAKNKKANGKTRRIRI